jgi:hypothetical protein
MTPASGHTEHPGLHFFFCPPGFFLAITKISKKELSGRVAKEFREGIP